MKKLLGLVLAILIIVALILGISTTDLWNYILDFTKVVVQYLVQWIGTIIDTLKTSLKTGIENNAETTTSNAFISLLYF